MKSFPPSFLHLYYKKRTTNPPKTPTLFFLPSLLSLNPNLSLSLSNTLFNLTSSPIKIQPTPPTACSSPLFISHSVYNTFSTSRQNTPLKVSMAFLPGRTKHRHSIHIVGFGQSSSTEDEGSSPRSVLQERRLSCSFPLSPFNDGFRPRLSLSSYQKLPPHFFKLSVLKLDGSSFDVDVLGIATVGELKQAVEDIFNDSPIEDQGEISWSHVWGHFCLCYEGEKLINDKDYIRNFGIKDGDQLHFLRHLSMDYRLTKRRSKKESATSKKQQTSLTDSNARGDKVEGFDGYVNGDMEEGYGLYYQYDSIRDEEFIGHSEFKLAHLLKDWLSHSKQWFARKKKSDHRLPTSRFSGQYLKQESNLKLLAL